MAIISDFENIINQEVEYFRAATSGLRNCPAIRVIHNNDPEEEEGEGEGEGETDEHTIFTLQWTFAFGPTVKAIYDINSEFATYLFVLTPEGMEPDMYMYNNVASLHHIVLAWLHQYNLVADDLID